ncbi:MAG: HlyD family efflux transporter periplasmic adaptor subunit, partial [bacterium]|nr:HlyD family efflux transporter periplasmic adaptor subunit [bacterium]
QSTLKSSREALIDAGTTIKERELSLAKTKEGPDDLDVRAKKITIQQRADALTTAKEALAEHYVRAPFAGMIAKLNAQKGDTASAGTAIVTLVTKQKIAEISLNEIDVAKVKAGQKVTLTFDAVPGLSISGVVAEVDAVGTVTQGVVNYGLKIGFDTNDDRVKSGMSVSAAIITDIKQDVIAVPASAVKSLGNTYSVQVIDVPGLPVVFGQTVPQQGVLLPSTPREVAVEIGLSNDILTEIISGLQEGETVVTRTVTPSTGATTQAPSLFGGGGGGRALR